MYHVTKNKKGEYYVVLVGKNGEPLSTSEPFKSLQKAWGNIKAQLNASGTSFTHVQDDTSILAPTNYGLFHTGKKSKSNVRSPKYIPGKNHKKKK